MLAQIGVGKSGRRSKIPNLEKPTGESENLTEISPPDSPSDKKREGVYSNILLEGGIAADVW